MKSTVKKILFFILFVVLIFWGVGIRVNFLFDIRELTAVVLGTLFLTMARFGSRTEIHTFLAFAKWNAYLTGFIITFMTIAVRFGEFSPGDDRLLSSIEWFRPLLYGGILYVLLDVGLDKNHQVQKIWIWDTGQLNAFFISAQLTQREIEVAHCLIRGMSNRHIAVELFIAESTVKRHASHLYTKLSVLNREDMRETLLKANLGHYQKEEDI